jgi:transcriptional regulator with XRE-family HTH domain
MTGTITTNAPLRGLLRTARRHTRLSQKEAAAKAGVSSAWWKRVESAYETSVSAETLADMLDAVGVLPGHLDDLGEHVLAELIIARQSFRDTVTSSQESLEEYLMNAPAADDLRHELITYVRTRSVLRTIRSDPFTDQFHPDSAEKHR